MVATANQLYNVGGVLLERPFKVRRLGHIGLSFTDMPAALRFYRTLLGFRISDVIDWRAPVVPAKLEGPVPLFYLTPLARGPHSFLFWMQHNRQSPRPV